MTRLFALVGHEIHVYVAGAVNPHRLEECVAPCEMLC